MNNKIENINVRIDSKGWYRICECFEDDKFLIRANHISKSIVVPDTARDKTQEAKVKGFVRIRPKRTFNIRMPQN